MLGIRLTKSEYPASVVGAVVSSCLCSLSAHAQCKLHGVGTPPLGQWISFFMIGMAPGCCSNELQVTELLHYMSHGTRG